MNDLVTDFVIIGGGTAGSVVAARLSEDPSVSVLVLEAGMSKEGDLLVEAPVLRGQNLMNPEYDWGLESVPQQHAKSRVWPLPRGRMLGGSSAQNFLVWNVAHAKEYDHMGECIGDPSIWNWNEISRCVRKATHFHPAWHPQQLEHGALGAADANIHGSNGPIDLSYSRWHGPLHKQFNNAFDELGLRKNLDGVSGDPIGYWCSPATVNPRTGRRSDAAAAYIRPHLSRPNLKVLTGAYATRIGLDSGSHEPPRATGVHFVIDGKAMFAQAEGEVICCAGTLLTPKLLELSGIGSSSVLAPLDIEVKVDLPGVGEQLQDHIILYSLVQLKDEFAGRTWDVLRDELGREGAMKQFLDADASSSGSAGGDYDRGIVASTVCGLAFLPTSQLLEADQREKLRTTGNQYRLDWLVIGHGRRASEAARLARR